MATHIPNTSESSYPHSSPTEPREHVDIYHYGKDGERESITSHVTDKDSVSWGRATKEFNESKKNK